MKALLSTATLILLFTVSTHSQSDAIDREWQKQLSLNSKLYHQHLKLMNYYWNAAIRADSHHRDTDFLKYAGKMVMENDLASHFLDLVDEYRVKILERRKNFPQHAKKR